MIEKRKPALPFLPDRLAEEDFFETLWDESWIYVKSVVNAGREPILILDKEFFVMVANKSFYQTFQVTKEVTEGVALNRLGNGQWNNSSLRRLLTDLLTKESSFKSFEVTRKFPNIGNKVMLLSARKMYYRKEQSSEKFLPVILLSFEDITDLVSVAQSFAKQLNQHQQHE